MNTTNTTQQRQGRWEVHLGTRQIMGTLKDTWQFVRVVDTCPTRDDAKKNLVALQCHASRHDNAIADNGVFDRKSVLRVFDTKNKVYLGDKKMPAVVTQSTISYSQVVNVTPVAPVVISTSEPAPSITKRLVNHVVFVIDASPSMRTHERNVSTVFDNLLQTMASMDIDTRVSIYSFSDARLIKQHTFDQPVKSVARFNYTTHGGSTALIDAAHRAIQDQALTALAAAKNPDEDHSFLIYVLTDGQENSSHLRATDLQRAIAGLDDSWTVAAMVPNAQGVHYAKMCGFSPGNIEVWKVDSARGFEEAGFRMANTYTAYATNRAAGVRSTKSLFSVEARDLTTREVQQNLTEITGGIYTSDGTYQIRDFVEKMTGKPFQLGTAFYELSKREEIQPQKEVVIVSKKDGRKYGGAAARQLLGLPNYHINVAPGDFGDWRIFIQSTSVNRKITPGTNVYIK